MKTTKIFVVTMALMCAMSLTASVQKPVVQPFDKSTKMSSWLYDKYVQQQDEVKKSGGALRAQGRKICIGVSGKYRR